MKKLIPLLLTTTICIGQPVVPGVNPTKTSTSAGAAPATSAEVIAGTVENKYVSPKTLADAGLSSPTNGITSTQATNINNLMALVNTNNTLLISSNQVYLSTNSFKARISNTGVITWDTTTNSITLFSPQYHDAEKVAYFGVGTTGEDGWDALTIQAKDHTPSGTFSGQYAPRITMMFGNYVYGWRFELTNFTLGDGFSPAGLSIYSYEPIINHNNENIVNWGSQHSTNRFIGVSSELVANNTTIKSPNTEIKSMLTVSSPNFTTNLFYVKGGVSTWVNGIYTNADVNVWTNTTTTMTFCGDGSGNFMIATNTDPATAVNNCSIATMNINNLFNKVNIWTTPASGDEPMMYIEPETSSYTTNLTVTPSGIVVNGTQTYWGEITDQSSSVYVGTGENANYVPMNQTWTGVSSLNGFTTDGSGALTNTFAGYYAMSFSASVLASATTETFNIGIYTNGASIGVLGQCTATASSYGSCSIAPFTIYLPAQTAIRLFGSSSTSTDIGAATSVSLDVVKR